MQENRRYKIFRISTVPTSMNNFCKGFLAQLSEEYDVVAISSAGNALKEIEERENIRTIPIHMERRISILKDFISLINLVRLFMKEKPDLVHSMTPKAGLLSMVAGFLTRVPIRIHTFTGLVFPTKKGFIKYVLIAMDKITCWCATYINPEGEGVKTDLKRITNKPLHIIGNGNVRGVDMNYYSQTESLLKISKSLREDNTKIFCYVGRIVQDKGINELVEAFSKLVKEFSNIKLFLIGDYEDKIDPILPITRQCIEQIREIEFCGYQNDVRPWLLASDYFVLPSYREGFPNSVLEAGAMGLPCIVTNINGSNEIIENGINGEIVEPKDAEQLYRKMREWLLNPEKVEEMAKNARGIVESKFEQQCLWDNIQKTYKELLSNKCD